MDIPAIATSFLFVSGLLLGGAKPELTRESSELGPPHRDRGKSQNILVIVLDDLGVEELQVYGLGSDYPSTPNIDELAKSGIVFTNAWAAPVCTPTRACIQTGGYPNRTGLGTVIFDGVVNPSNIHLEDAITIPKVLSASKDAGYRSAAIGKWHLSYFDDPELNIAPNQAGYDYFSGTMHRLKDYYDYELIVNGVPTFVTNVYATTQKVDEAVSWINGNKTSPWFMYLALHNPHGPFHAPPSHLHSIDLSTAGNPSQDSRPYFKAMVEAVDSEIGRLIDFLKNAEEWRDTTIVLLGDNGSVLRVKPVPLSQRGGKGSLYEGGINVPFIVSGSSVVEPGRGNDELVNVADIFSTVAEIAGVPLSRVLPPDHGHDSVSLLPYLQDPNAASQRTLNFMEIFQPNGISESQPIGPLDPEKVEQRSIGFQGPGMSTLRIKGQVLAFANSTDLFLTGAEPNALATIYLADEIVLRSFAGGFLIPGGSKLTQIQQMTDANGELFIEDFFRVRFRGPEEWYAQVLTRFIGNQGLVTHISNAVKLNVVPYNLKAIRERCYKLIANVNGGQDQLYNLCADPGEVNNLLVLGLPSVGTVEREYYDYLSCELDNIMDKTLRIPCAVNRPEARDTAVGCGDTIR